VSEELEGVAESTQETDVETGSAALSLALGRAGRAGKGFDADARALLRKQARLIDLQTEHLHEQREVTLSRLRWGRFSDRMKALLQVMTACIGLAVAGGIGWMAWSASQDRGLVIQPFSVPPELAAKGLTGQVVASMLLDRLGEMQNATDSSRAPSTYANNWNDQIKVEIPETGVSVGELQRLLVQWLGHQTSISGELYRTPTGLALEARTGAAPARSHPGAEADIDAMVEAAAEDVYATTQPYRYAVWLGQSAFKAGGVDQSRMARSQALMRHLLTTGDPIDRIWAAAGLSDGLFNANGDIRGSIATATSALQIEPRFSIAYANRADAESGGLGHDEAALADDRIAAATTRTDGRRFYTAKAQARLAAYDRARLDASFGDWGEAARDEAQVVALQPDDDLARQNQALAQTLNHQIEPSRATAAGLGGRDPSDASMEAAIERDALAERDALEAYVLEDWRRLVAGLRQVDLAPAPEGFRRQFLIGFTPYLALGLAETGDAAGARALIATTPADCYLCVRMRGRIEAAAGDWPAAERWFAEAVRQGPSLPFAEAEWGRALLDRGDAAGAIARLEAAHRKGPNFADALETWGEALTAQKDYTGAAAKFAEADKHAPAWGKNHLKWGQALMLARRYREARAQFETAAGLEMSAPDRAALFLLRETARRAVHG
jgi:tetratricopeptide (TPR) repeat protein